MIQSIVSCLGGKFCITKLLQVKRVLRGVKVEVTHRGNFRRKYRISGLTSQPTRELVYVSNQKLIFYPFFFSPSPAR